MLGSSSPPTKIYVASGILVGMTSPKRHRPEGEADARLSRRESLRRLAILGIGPTAASALLTSCGESLSSASVTATSLPTEGPPSSGEWQTGDMIRDKYGGVYQCLAGGTPGSWQNISPGFQDQLQTEFNRQASYILGGPVTLSAVPSSLPLADSSRMEEPDERGPVRIIIGTGVPGDGTPENRVFATYTGISGNRLTGVVTEDGATKTVADGLKVWYGRSDLRSSYLRVANGIIARSAVDGLPHDLVLCAAYDDSGRDNRADYDIILTREPGSYGVLSITLPVRFPNDVSFSSGNGTPLFTFAGGPLPANPANENPLPSGTIAVHGTLTGAAGNYQGDLQLKTGHADAKMFFRNSAGTQMFGIDEAGAYVPNQASLRFMGGNSDVYCGISVDDANRFNVRSPSGGIRFLNQDFTADFLEVSDAGLRINATENSSGSGVKPLIDAEVNGVSLFSVDKTGQVSISGTRATIQAGGIPPEGSVSAEPGSMYLNTSGGPGVTLYVKESGSGNTGWVAK